MSESTIKDLRSIIPQIGVVRWLGIRPARIEPLQITPAIEIDCQNSIVGDHFSGPAGSKRQVTLIQQEHIEAISSILGKPVPPEALRRNIVVSGINLQSLIDQQFRIGSAVLRGTGDCHPCSRMEFNLGPGGYNAMRGHGGITATVIKSGRVNVGDAVSHVPEGNNAG
jgi:MOSC domain-containing protein YiiM